MSAEAVLLSREDYLRSAVQRLDDARRGVGDEYLCGIDLGTSSVVLTLIDREGSPLYLTSVPCAAVRDGVVVDFAGAVSAVTVARERAQAALGISVESAATAHPPGVGESEARACRYVLEQAGLECADLLDEVTAANRFLDLRDAVLVDVGAGSTGVGIILDGDLNHLADVPGGGYHLDLILAGALGISIAEAEELKRLDGASHLQILRPGIERIATSIASLSRGFEELPVHLVGGGLMIDGASQIVSGYLGRTTNDYPHSLFITPLGLCWSIR